MGVGLRASTRYCAPVERSRAGPFASGGDPASLPWQTIHLLQATTTCACGGHFSYSEQPTV
jgi:hypothetical protein